MLSRVWGGAWRASCSVFPIPLHNQRQPSPLSSASPSPSTSFISPSYLPLASPHLSHFSTRSQTPSFPFRQSGDPLSRNPTWLNSSTKWGPLVSRHFQSSRPAGSQKGASEGKGSNDDKDSGKGNSTEDLMKPFLYILPAILLSAFLFRETGNEISLSAFLRDILPHREDIASVKVYNKRDVEVVMKTGKKHRFSIGSVEVFESLVEQAQEQKGIAYENFLPILYDTRQTYDEKMTIVSWVLFFGVMVYLAMKALPLGGKGGAGASPFSMGKSPAKVFNHETAIKVRFDQVAGLDEAKQEILEFVSFLKRPKDFQKLGAKLPRGALLVGPPGTGKTLIAKATAGEAGVPFFSISGSDFLELYVGVGPSRVRNLFSTAKANSPCIIFIDEIDAIGRKRGRSEYQRSNDERESTLNQLLVEMDGFDTDSGVVVLAGTNIPEVLDPALLRAGRFDRQITIDKPDIRSRRDIFMVYLKKVKVSDEFDIGKLSERLAALTPGLSGADIANICNEAALRAARLDKKGVEVEDFEHSIERVIAGLERKLVLSHDEKKTVAYHEAGHAVLGWFLRHTHPLMKVSIIPRGQAALGYAQYLPRDQYLYTKAQIEDMVSMALGGRIAEEVSFGRITTGASDDLDRVTKMMYSLVTKYGMGSLGALSFSQSRGEGRVAQYSEGTAALIDEEVRGEVLRLYEQSKQLLLEKKDLLTALAEELLKKEVMTRDDVAKILGPRPFEAPDAALEMFDQSTRKTPPNGDSVPSHQ